MTKEMKRLNEKISKYGLRINLTILLKLFLVNEEFFFLFFSDQIGPNSG